MKAATRIRFQPARHRTISIHAAREGGDAPDAFDVVVVDISIHAAREGGDADRTLQQVDAAISIHAAREGGDIWHVPFL